MRLNELSGILYLFGNDLRMLHLNCVGKDFLYIHKELNDFYDEVFDFYDDVAESALAQSESICNPSDLILDTPLWNSVQGNSFGSNEILSIVIKKGNKVLDFIKKIDTDYPKHIYSMLDSISEYLDKEINYKFKRSDM